MDARPEYRAEPAAGDPLHELDVLLRTRYGLVLIDSAEHERVATLLRHAADGRGLPLFEWSRTRGLRRSDVTTNIYDTAEPAGALAHIEPRASPRSTTCPACTTLLRPTACSPPGWPMRPALSTSS